MPEETRDRKSQLLPHPASHSCSSPPPAAGLPEQPDLILVCTYCVPGLLCHFILTACETGDLSHFTDEQKRLEVQYLG